MLNGELSKAETWADPIDYVVRAARDRGHTQVVIAEVSANSTASSIGWDATLLVDDGRIFAHVKPAVGDGEIVCCITGHTDGSAELIAVDNRSPHLAASMSDPGPVDGVLLDPEQVPDPFRLVPEEIARMSFSRQWRVFNEDPGRFLVHIRNGARLKNALRPHTEMLTQNYYCDRLDLTALSGHRKLRTVCLDHTDVTGLEFLTTLPELKYLSLPAVLWRSLIDSGGLPPGLVLAGFEHKDDESFASLLELVNRLLLHYDHRPLEVIRINVPPKT